MRQRSDDVTAAANPRSRLRAVAFGVRLAFIVIALVAPLGASHLSAAPSACGLEGVERIVAVSDAHGAYDRYIAILRAAGVIDDRQRWSGGRTHLVQLGDMVDRGPDSRKILDLLRKLEREADSKGGAVHVLLGNHEIMRMLGDLRYVSPGEYQAFVKGDSEETRQRLLEARKAANPDATPPDLPLGSIEMQLAFDARGDYGKWLRTLDAVARINGVLFLHGGISPAVAPTSCDEINEKVRRELTTDLEQSVKAPNETLAMGDQGPLWYRGLAQEAETFAPAVDTIVAQQGVQVIVIGHTVAPSGRIRPRFAGKVIPIDTGMNPAYVQGGRASALEIQGGRFTAIYVDGKEPLDVPVLQPAAPK